MDIDTCEKWAIGALLGGCVEVADILSEDDLQDPICKAIYATYKKSGLAKPNFSKLAEIMGNDDAMTQMVSLETECLAVECGTEYARHVRRIRQKQKLAVKLKAAADQLLFDQGDSDVIIEEIRKAIELAESNANTSAVSLADFLRKNSDEIIGHEETGLSSGYSDFDHYTGGFFPGELIVLAGRPGMAKTTFMLNLIRCCGLKTIIFSLEMTALELARKVVCAQAHVSARHTMARGADMLDAMGKLYESANIVLVDTPALSVPEIASHCYAHRDVKLICIDYAQLLGRYPGTDNSRESLAESVKALKALAKRLGATVILLSQLNREGAHSKALETLAETDELGRSPDLVATLKWADDDPDPESELSPKPVRVNLNLIKNRHGNAGAQVPFLFFRSESRFEQEAWITDKLAG